MEEIVVTYRLIIGIVKRCARKIIVTAHKNKHWPALTTLRLKNGYLFVEKISVKN